mmetsp:Transcript_6654/g.7596  ORF Transcript_6654/g.7596 Transcript_6654/m.7596 type:complete len:220 (+) Transcript_6654:240-899(+)
MYICNNIRVGESIKNTMYSTKIFLNDQYNYMQRLYLEEQERIRKEKERLQNATSAQGTTGFASRLFSALKFKTNQQQPSQNTEPQKSTITIVETDHEPKEEPDASYLLSTNNQVQNEEGDLIDFGGTSKVSQNKATEETEVRVKLEDKEIVDDEETKRSDTDTNLEDKFEDISEVPAKTSQPARPRSDSLSSTSTTKMYSYSDFNDFMNVDELNKFLYK